ncbi:lamin tail domain-containing protein [Streptomyces antimycoticus]|uniref:LTD domain-containing protein n=1 Tax=Streptomyces mordarskii TaxID=1226758 RepID=A0ABN1DGL6_9ACTN|nr:MULTISPECIES: lamin tail domain-containing protein [Streptomyces]AJZ83773.2 lamin tail domain-containing protein [Streptomyces sp. AgN23]WJD95614.1 lamin tail domain-containing protein [Streptomyces antimycoticus]WTA85586.1 lamin tail domain-containing protein [Streptomyces antimycoticus]
MSAYTARIGAALAAGCALALLYPATPAGAAGSVHLSKIYYDSPGTDNRSTSSLNGEYVQIKNSTSRGVSLKGWVLVDASNHKYTFPSYTLGAGKTVTVRTGIGSDTSATKYQDRRAYVWNNDADKATLRKTGGSTVDTCSYNSSRVDYKIC